MKKIWFIIFVITILCTACGDVSQNMEEDTQRNESVNMGIEINTETEVEPEITELLISAVGDCTLGTNQKHSYSKSFHEYYDIYGEDYFLKNVKSIFEDDDFTIVNLEGTLTNSTNMMKPKEFNHKGRPEYVSILTNASIEAVTLGNNHIMDYLQEGADDTIATVDEAGLAYALSGDWGNQYGIYETKGVKIGFVSVNEYYDGQRVYLWLEEGLKELREQGADIVIAALHWGEDKTHVIEEDQKTLGRWCIDQGYDLVLGCHPHLLQGIEVYNGKYIVYSMGNFCYGGSKNPAEKETIIFQMTFTLVDGVLQPQATAKVIPCSLSSITNANDYCPVILEGEEAQKVIENLNHYSEEFGVMIQEDGSIHMK